MTVDRDFKKIADDLDSLEGYAVAVRYPGAIVSLELAEQAFESATLVRNFTRKKLGV